MRVYQSLDAFERPPAGVVLTIGNFDGVHRGHRMLVDLAKARAGQTGAQVAVLTFEPHPLVVLRPEHAPPRLTTTAEKAYLLDQLGVGALVILPTERGLLQQSADEFLQAIVDACAPQAVVEGPTFTFGRGREGTPELLRSRAAMMGFDVLVPDELRCKALADAPEINSSAIRSALADGALERANAMLGRRYRITGRVARGDQRGAGLGFPTANVEAIPQLIPGHAVYAAVAETDDGRRYRAAVNVGPQPTFAQLGARVEAHLLDFEGDLLGRSLGLHFVRRLRGQQKFANAEALRAQLRADVSAAREVELEEPDALRQLPLGGDGSA